VIFVDMNVIALHLLLSCEAKLVSPSLMSTLDYISYYDTLFVVSGTWYLVRSRALASTTYNLYDLCDVSGL